MPTHNKLKVFFISFITEQMQFEEFNENENPEDKLKRLSV